MISKQVLGAKILNLGTAGRTKYYTSKYNANKFYTWTYDKVKSPSYVYVFRGYTTYKDAEGKEKTEYTPQIYQSIDSLLKNAYIYES